MYLVSNYLKLTGKKISNISIIKNVELKTLFLFSIKNGFFVGLPNSLLVPTRFGRLYGVNIAFKKFNASFVYVEEVHFFKEIGHFFD